MMLLIPCDAFSPSKPDEQFADEAAAARDRGIEVAVVDHDALCRPGREAEAVRRVPAGEAVYRGWMLPPARYVAFSSALAAREAALRTDPAAYRRAHELPSWYASLAPHTPASEWTEGSSLDALFAGCARLAPGAAILKDYVKSAKHDWAEACFIPDLADRATVERIARRFLELRGDDFAGGFVVRRFENLAGAEVRTWWRDGECRLLTAHPDTPDQLPPGDLDVSPFAAAVRTVNSPFVTLDLVRNTDGNWRAIEIGDGQVSDRPTSISAPDFVTAVLG
jgi:hypothetical protein